MCNELHMLQMKNEKKKNPCQHQLCESAESYGLGGYFEKKYIYKDVIQTNNFTGVKIRNALYSKGVNHY